MKFMKPVSSRRDERVEPATDEAARFDAEHRFGGSGAPPHLARLVDAEHRVGLGIEEGPESSLARADGRSLDDGSLGVGELPRGWVLQRIEINQTDVTDRPIDLRRTERLPVTVTVTNQLTRLHGLVMHNGSPAAAAGVLVMAADPRRWRHPTRFIGITTADDQGRFTLEGLPPADYLAIALDDIDEDELLDLETLARLRPGGVPVTLAAGAPATVSLTLGER
jgi:hypothetical protein